MTNPVLALVHAIRNFFEHPFLETDGFSQRCRKYILTVGLLIPALNLMLILSRIAKMRTMDPDVIVAWYGDALLTVLFVPSCYLYLWKTRTMSDTLANLVFYFMLGILLYQSLRSVNGGIIVFIPALMVCSTVAQMKYVEYLCGIAMAIVGLHYYNLNAVTKGISASVMLPIPWGRRSTCNESDEIMLFFYASVIAMMIWLVFLQTKAFNQQLKMAHANTEVARMVADLLGEYKTEAAAAVIAERGPGCDTSLTDSLSTIIRNMELYRPHLPNYMLQPTILTPTDVLTDDSHSSPRSPSLYPSPINGCFQDDPLQSSTCNEVVALPVQQQHHGRGDATFHTRHATVARVLYHRMFSVRAGHDAASMRFGVGKFIEDVLLLAQEHNAAVHCFMGDEVMLSWNSITRCVNHYTNGSTFVMDLQASQSKECEFLTVCASGLMRCQRGGTKTFAWTLHAPQLFQELFALSVIASQSNTIVTTKSHAEQMQHCVTSQAIDAVVLTSEDGDSRVCVVHEMMRLHVTRSSLDDQEWMYRIQEQGKTDEESILACVSDCVKMALAGSCLDALSTLENICEKYGQSAITRGTKHLLKRLNQCVEGRLGFPQNIVELHKASKSK